MSQYLRLEVCNHLLVAEQLGLLVNKDTLQFLILVSDVRALGSNVPNFSLIVVFEQLKILLEPLFNYLPLILYDLSDGYLLVTCLHLRDLSVCRVLTEKHLDLVLGPLQPLILAFVHPLLCRSNIINGVLVR